MISLTFLGSVLVSAWLQMPISRAMSISIVFDMYAYRTLKEIEQNGYYVRVPAGKEFYVYVAEAVDPAKARVPGPRPAASAAPATTPAPPPPQQPNEKAKG